MNVLHLYNLWICVQVLLQTENYSTSLNLSFYIHKVGLILPHSLEQRWNEMMHSQDFMQCSAQSRWPVMIFFSLPLLEHNYVCCNLTFLPQNPSSIHFSSSHQQHPSSSVFCRSVFLFTFLIPSHTACVPSILGDYLISALCK